MPGSRKEGHRNPNTYSSGQNKAKRKREYKKYFDEKEERQWEELKGKKKKGGQRRGRMIED